MQCSVVHLFRVPDRDGLVFDMDEEMHNVFSTRTERELVDDGAKYHDMMWCVIKVMPCSENQYLSWTLPLLMSGSITLKASFLGLMPFDVTVVDLCNIVNTFVVALQANTKAAVTCSVAPAIGTKATHPVEADVAKADFVL